MDPGQKWKAIEATILQKQTHKLLWGWVLTGKAMPGLLAH